MNKLLRSSPVFVRLAVRFINNAKSGLTPVNQEVLDGVVNNTFKTAYECAAGMPSTVPPSGRSRITPDFAPTVAGCRASNVPQFPTARPPRNTSSTRQGRRRAKRISPCPFSRTATIIHGRIGRGVISFLGWRIGPWFDNTFNHRNYPNNNAADFKVRHDIVVKFMDSLNTMLKGLAAPPDVLHVDLTGTLQTKNDWAKERFQGASRQNRRCPPGQRLTGLPPASKTEICRGCPLAIGLRFGSWTLPRTFSARVQSTKVNGAMSAAAMCRVGESGAPHG